MNLMRYVPGAVTRTIGRQSLILKKNSPHILFAAGVVGVATGTVLACRATLKLSDTLTDVQKDIANVKELNGANGVEEQNKDLVYIYGKGAVRIVRLYTPAVVVGGLGIAALTGSHIQLTHRNNALMAAYATLEKAYSDYRDRVREEVGEEKERDLYLGARELVEKDFEGKSIDPTKVSPYARFFDQFSPNWQKDAELNRIFLTCQQTYANQRLNAVGHIFLNEVYDMLGLERSRQGQVIGWVRDGDGDAWVDFGMFEARNARFVDNLERSVLLDFNVHGVIYDKI